MSNEILELMDNNGFTAGETRTAYEKMINTDASENIGSFSRAADERINAFKAQYGEMYSADALKEGIQNIINEEKAKAEASINKEAETIDAQRRLIEEKADAVINKSEDLSSDEITKRVYHTNLMTNELSMKVSSITRSSDLNALINECLEAAKHDRYKAHALNGSLYILNNAINNLNEHERGLSNFHLNNLKNELDEMLTPSDVKVYRKLKDEMKKYEGYQNAAARLTMDAALEKYKREYGL